MTKLDTATELSLVNLSPNKVRTLRVTAESLTTAETGENSYGWALYESRWFKIVVPDDYHGFFRFSVKWTATDEARVTAKFGASALNNCFVAMSLYEQKGSGYSGLKYAQNSTRIRLNQDGVSLYLDCEGNLQGRSYTFGEWAVRAGQTFFIKFESGRVSPTGSVDEDFVMQWSFLQAPQVTQLTAEREIVSCSGEQLETWGTSISLLDPEGGGWPAFFAAGPASMPNAPDMPAQGHAFSIWDYVEFGYDHNRIFLVGWTEDSGPFYYAPMTEQGAYRTSWWEEDYPWSNGIGTPNGNHHQIVEHNELGQIGSYQETLRSVVDGMGSEPIDGWAGIDLYPGYSGSAFRWKIDEEELDYGHQYSFLRSLNYETRVVGPVTATEVGQVVGVNVAIPIPGTTSSTFTFLKNDVEFIVITVPADDMAVYQPLSVSFTAGDVFALRIDEGGNGAYGLDAVLLTEYT